MTKKTALITGASGGIGYELAKVFAREGFNLVLVARSGARLQEIAADFKTQHNTETRVMVKDLGRAGAPDEIFAELQGTQIDVLVNNAGFATYGHFETLDLAKELEMIQVNITALTHLTRLFLPGMKERSYGRIMNVASTAAFQPGPLMAVYYASKAFVLSFSEAIARELKGSGVYVSALCPGPTESGFQKRAAMEESKLVQNGLMDAATVAEQGYEGLMKGRTVVIPGMRNRIMSLAPRFLPRETVTAVVMQAQERVQH